MQYAEVPTPNSLLSTVYTVRQYFSTFLSIFCVSWLTTKSRSHTVHREYFADTFDATMQGYSLVYPGRKCCYRFTAGLRFTFLDEASSVPLSNSETPRFCFDASPSILANFVNCGVHSACSDWFISVMCSTTNAMIGCFVGDTRKVTKNTWADEKKKKRPVNWFGAVQSHDLSPYYFVTKRISVISPGHITVFWIMHVNDTGHRALLCWKERWHVTVVRGCAVLRMTSPTDLSRLPISRTSLWSI